MGDDESIAKSNYDILQSDHETKPDPITTTTTITTNTNTTNTNTIEQTQQQQQPHLENNDVQSASATQTESPTKVEEPTEHRSTAAAAESTADTPAPKKPERSAELSRSILAGDISDNSECSVDEGDDDDEVSDYADDKAGVSDEEMSMEDQDQEEDVGEEEEFHEVEEEKHKTSQESVGGGDKIASSPEAKEQSTTPSSPKAEKKKEEESQTSQAEDEAAPEVVEQPQQQLKAETTQEASGDKGEKLATASAECSSKTEDVIPPSDTTAGEKDENEVTSADNPKSDEATGSKPATAKNTDWVDIMSNVQSSNDQSEDRPENAKQTDDSGEDKGTEAAAGQEKVEEKGDDAEKKELDLDEDVKNPQYIPKKGVFYEHDDRSHDVNSKKQPSTLSNKEDDEVVEAKESASNKKPNSTQEKQNEGRRGSRRQRTETDHRWNHDLFRDEKQKPKSKLELEKTYGYDIRQERASRSYADNRPQQRGSNNSNVDRPQGSQDNQRSRQNRDNRDNRTLRQNQPSNRSRERRGGGQRRQNNRNRPDTSGTPAKRDVPNNRSVKTDSKDIKQQHELTDGKQGFQQNPQTQSSALSTRRDHQDGLRDKNTRIIDNRGRRQNSKDRPSSNSVDDKLPPINTVMPPITTWSNKIEDMVKEEASHKESPSRHNQQQQHLQSMNNNAKGRSNDYWPQNQQNKGIYNDRPVRNLDDNRQPQQQHSHNSRRYQDRDEAHKPAHFVNRNHVNERPNQHHQEWRRNNHYNNSYAKPNEYEPIKTQTFENSRLSQTNMNRSNFRDAREIINERRMQNQQQNFQPKVQPGSSGPEQQLQQQQRQIQHQQHHHQLVQQHQQLIQHQQMVQHQQQQHQHSQQPPNQHLRQQQPPSAPHPQQPAQSQAPQQQSQQAPQQPLQGQRQPQPQQQPQPTSQAQHQTQQRQGLVMNNMSAEGGVQEPSRLSASNSNTSDLINSRPIIKTDAYTGTTVAAHTQQPQSLQQHSQNHRSLGGSMSQQGPSSAASHLVPSHMSAGGTQAQYYTQSNNSRDSAAAAAALGGALATAYHGYMPSGHSVMDATRYHMTSQQLSDHVYMASPGQSNDVAATSVLHQQGMYTDAASAGGTVASSAYLAQAGSTLSPSNNIPVTGAGPPPLAPVSYLQHSQYAPPPYTNPYSQPQHNQAPQSSHAYNPYWTYI